MTFEAKGTSVRICVPNGSSTSGSDGVFLRCTQGESLVEMPM